MTWQAMGDKTAARKLAIEVGVPIVPGTNEALMEVSGAFAFAAEVGYPIILKAAMGGGGRGMRVVRSGTSPALRSLLFHGFSSIPAFRTS